MLVFPFGSIQLLVNGCPQKYIEEQLFTETKSFSVDSRIKISTELPPSSEAISVYCFLKGGQITGKNIQTDEGLAAISFDIKGYRITIGTTGDIWENKYFYLDDGINVIFPASLEKRKISFCIAKKKIKAEKIDDDSTWLAVDIW